MTLALISWAVIPFDEDFILTDINVGILYLFAVSSLGVYGIIMGGWASNSKYPFLEQLDLLHKWFHMISIGVIIINVLLCVGSLNLTDIVLAREIMVCNSIVSNVVIFYIALAETNGHLLIYPKQRQS